MTTVTANTPTSLEEASELIVGLCKLLEECYATIDQVDAELFEDNYEEAEMIIERFYVATEEIGKKQWH
jgi:hypothetical protein|tara:strand:- start:151 stop:357 length:207 start_codon:yes stop_codon:yes gene_type:complete